MSRRVLVELSIDSTLSLIFSSPASSFHLRFSYYSSNFSALLILFRTDAVEIRSRDSGSLSGQGTNVQFFIRVFHIQECIHK